MSSSRPFAYNTGALIAGTDQVGDIAIGWPTAGFESTGLEWWNGPDEELGYVICKPIPSDTQPTQFKNTLTLSATYKATDIALSNNYQTAHQIFSYQQSVLGNTEIGVNDKVMFSVLFNSSNAPVGVGSRVIGFGYTTMNYQGNPFGGYPGNDNKGMGFSDDGKIYYNGIVYYAGLGITWTDGDVIDILINNSLSAMWVRVNGGYWNDDPDVIDPLNSSTSAIEIISGPFYPVLCPSIFGTMTIQNTTPYSVPEGFTLLGDITASIAFSRSTDLTEVSFVNLVNSLFVQNFSNGGDSKDWLNINGYWTSYGL